LRIVLCCPQHALHPTLTQPLADAAMRPARCHLHFVAGSDVPWQIDDLCGGAKETTLESRAGLHKLALQR
jgi:hypothetical protein